ncbi:MAG: hypothetical protein II875_10235 [Clostridia bacterium]|nr:hypothetical protein [Clostridia bacterium]
MKRFAVFFLSAALLIGLVCPAYAYDNPFVSPRGSCDYIGGTTVLVAIFVNDPYCSWDFSDQADLSSYANIYWRLKTASEWLTRQANRYRAYPNIIWDWYNQPYLYYVYDSDRYICDQSYTYGDLRDFITDRINLPYIKSYYGADNVIFMAYYNSTKTMNIRGNYAWSWDFDPNAKGSYAMEICWIVDEEGDLTISAGSLAHEMMHCFGAPDLYQSSDRISQAYVDHLKNVRSKDIMYYIDYYTPADIGEAFSELDAYYLGLTNSSYDQRRYNLGKSSHILY